MFWFTQNSCTQPPPIRHPWLNGGLFEHRVQTLLITYRTSSTSKFQTYLYSQDWIWTFTNCIMSLTLLIIGKQAKWPSGYLQACLISGAPRLVNSAPSLSVINKNCVISSSDKQSLKRCSICITRVWIFASSACPTSVSSSFFRRASLATLERLISPFFSIACNVWVTVDRRR